MPSRYALISYVHNPVGEFVENLRRELHPTTAHMAAHLTILPPRELHGSEAKAIEFLDEACSRVIPFDVELGDVETFLPTTPTVFIQVARFAYRMRELHDQLCANGMGYPESWPYIPHLTIVKTEHNQQAQEAIAIARQRWSEYTGPRRVHVGELMFVRETGDLWNDVAAVQLGRQLSSKA
jgi:2'-5' RNA ligase